MEEVLLWIFLFILLIFGVLYGIRGILEARIRRRLRREGIDGEAVVVGHWVMGTPRSGNTYYVKYRYYDQGHFYRREEQVGSNRYKAWPTGTRVAVRYLPQNPYVSRITSEKNHFLQTAVAILVFTLFMMVMIALAFS